jgi:hydroxypyruvate isomerase
VAANLAFLFTDVPWQRRPGRARDTGFDAVEFPWPPEPDRLAEAVRRAGVGVVLLNMPAGDLAAGERGFGNDPDRVGEWRKDLDQALRLAVRLGCPAVNVLAGTELAGQGRKTQVDCLARNLRWGAQRAADSGVRLVVEPINGQDIPGYLLPRMADLVAWLQRHGLSDAVGVQLDTYHLGMAGEDPVTWIYRLGPGLGHVQLADHPGRHEPGTGSLPMPAILAALAESGYQGAVGLEYRPTPGSDPATVAAAVRKGSAAGPLPPTPAGPPLPGDVPPGGDR